jgi:hypothetical protein
LERPEEERGCGGDRRRDREAVGVVGAQVVVAPMQQLGSDQRRSEEQQSLHVALNRRRAQIP